MLEGILQMSTLMAPEHTAPTALVAVRGLLRRRPLWLVVCALYLIAAATARSPATIAAAAGLLVVVGVRIAWMLRTECTECTVSTASSPE
jgi:hypothetical protein